MFTHAAFIGAEVEAQEVEAQETVLSRDNCSQVGNYPYRTSGPCDLHHSCYSLTSISGFDREGMVTLGKIPDHFVTRIPVPGPVP